MAYFSFDQIMIILFLYGTCVTVVTAQGTVCLTGWDIIDRGGPGANGFTVVAPSQVITCHGSVSEWRYQAKVSQPLRAVVWRQVTGTSTQYEIVGINDIPAGSIDTEVTYQVPAHERFAVKDGDMIGWSSVAGVLTFSEGGGTLVHGVRENTHPTLVENQVLDINDPSRFREYSIKATVEEGNIKLSSVIYVTDESSRTVTYQIVREGWLYSGESVTLSTEDMTAVDGTDYKGVTDLTVQFDDDVTKVKTESIDIYTDFLDEGLEAFKIRISSSSPGTSVTGPEALAIINDSEPSVSTSGMFTFEKSKYDVTEGDAVTIQICRAGDLTATASVVLRTTNLDAETPGDFIDINNKRIDFAVGADKSDPININTVEDTVAEPGESFELTLWSLSVKISKAVVWIKDDDEPCPGGCGNGGFCMESINTCWCPAGYEGDQCQTSLCVPLCRNGGFCAGNRICLCPSGFIGAQCQIAFSLADRVPTFTIDGQLTIVSIDGVPAVYNPDLNVPGSSAREALLGYIMPLLNQFIGPLQGVLTTEITSFSRGSVIVKYTVTLESSSPTTADDIDRAMVTLIQYGSSSGLLFHSTNTYTLEPCSQTCENGGFCTASSNNCQCSSGYSGDQCQTKLCPPSCDNGGFCIESSGTCWCTPGYTGDQCQTSLCPPSCANGGFCINTKTCQCPPGYIGNQCEISLCVPICRNGGVCTGNGWCLCPQGFVGEQCQTDADSMDDLSRDQGTLSGGEIGGIIIGVLAIILLMILITILVCVHARQRRENIAGKWSPGPAATPNINTLDLSPYPYTYPRLNAYDIQNTMLF